MELHSASRLMYQIAFFTSKRNAVKRPTRRARGRLDSHRQISVFVALGFGRFVSESRPSSRR